MKLLKAPIRTFTFSFIAIYVTQLVIGGFRFGEPANITLLLIIGSLTILSLFSVPLLKIVSLPIKGPGYLFLSFVLNLIIFYTLAVFVGSFSVNETTVSELLILGVVLPSKSLTKTMSLVFSALLYVIVFNFFMWLSKGKR